MERFEIEQIWGIDRSEITENVYCLENGALVLKPVHFDLHGWPPGEAEIYTPILFDCFDRGGWFLGCFADSTLVGVAVLESKFIGREKDQLQLKFLHVDMAFRKQGIGSQLFELAKREARLRGAGKLYISSTPSQNTVDFYLKSGCVVAEELDPELFTLEPEDIHLECAL